MSYNKFPWTNLHGFNLDWVIETVQAAIASLEEFKNGVNDDLAEQNLKIEQYKQELEQIVLDYKNDLENEMEGQRDIFNEYYVRTLDVYNKTVEQVLVMQGYVDQAVSDFGSIAQWTISDEGELLATVFNDGVLISIGMTQDGRLEVTVNE